jgi:hypothetical protein
MRRFTPVFVVLLLVLVLPSVALAQTRTFGRATADGPTSLAALSAQARLGSTRAVCTITVLVKDASGNPVVNASVDASTSDYSAGSDTATTNAAGQASLANTPVTSSGILDIQFADNTQAYELTGQTFSEGAVIAAQPGSVAFTTDALGTNNAVHVDTYGPSGGAFIRLTATSGLVPAMPSSVNYAVAFWSAQQGADWVSSAFAGPNAPIAILAGQQASGQISIAKSTAKSIWIDSPYWNSGAPGTRVTFELDNWLSPVTAELAVISETSTVAMPAPLAFTGNSSATRPFSFVVPKKAKPGDTLVVRATRTDLTVPQDFRFAVRDYFQVCTLIASKSSIARGASVRLSGVVPANGSAKKVVLYSRTTKATAQPSNWNSPAGWKKVATLSASKTGVYKSGLLKPTKTTWYIVRYPGDANNFEAFTSVLKVTVH